MNKIKQGYKQTVVGVIPEDWEVKKLAKIGSFYKGKGISKSQLSETGLKAIRYGEIYTVHHYFIKQFYSFIDRNVAKASFPLISGDLLFTGSGETLEEIGKSVAFIGEEEVYAGGDIIILRPDKNSYNSKFLGFITNNDIFRKQTFRVGQGNAVVHIYPSNLKNLKLPIPPLPEQTAIADCLSTWDKGIEKLSALIASKKEQKKGLMQGLFSGKLKVENGELIQAKDGEDFTKEWKEVKLGEVFALKKGKNLSKSAVVDKGKHKCVLYGELYTKYSEVIKKVYSSTNEENSFLSKVNDVLIPSSTTTNGWDLITSSCIQEDNVMLGGDIIVLRPKNNRINSVFFSYLFSNAMHKEVIGYTQGVTIIHLYGSDLVKIKLNLPSIQEQTAIAEILQTADKEIELLEQKLESYKTQKKGLMQVLLTGEKRLVEN